MVHVRGGEKTFFELARAFPTADLFTLHYRPDALPDDIAGRLKGTSFLQGRPFRQIPYRAHLPLLPWAVESLAAIRGYELVISSSFGWAHGVPLSADARHLCYMYSPPRYLWGEAPPTVLPGLVALLSRSLISRLREWDIAAASRVDRFVGISLLAAQRISQTYGRTSDVVHPPVETERFHVHSSERGRFVMAVGELVPYKRFDLAILAARRINATLVVVGDGPSRRRLQRLAGGADVHFVGRVDDSSLQRLLAKAAVLIHPGIEDFGIVMVEALASGVPVVANSTGGAAEIVAEGTGLLVGGGTPDDFAEALQKAVSTRWDVGALRRQAENFSVARFRGKFRSAVAEMLSEHVSNGSD